MTEYELDGQRYVPNLPVTGQLKVTYQTKDSPEPNWTSYLVGTHHGKPLITLAAPQ